MTVLSMYVDTPDGRSHYIKFPLGVNQLCSCHLIQMARNNFTPSQHCQEKDVKCKTLKDERGQGEPGSEPGVGRETFPASVELKGSAEDEHGGQQRQTEQGERQIVQTSMPGGGRGAQGGVGGEGQAH